MAKIVLVFGDRLVKWGKSGILRVFPDDICQKQEHFQYKMSLVLSKLDLSC